MYENVDESSSVFITWWVRVSNTVRVTNGLVSNWVSVGNRVRVTNWVIVNNV